MIDSRERLGWDQLTDRLREFVGRRVSSADTDDVLQEALVRIQRGLPGLRDHERFGPWVYRVTRSAIGDHLRVLARQPKKGRPPDEDGIEAIPEDEERTTQGLVRCLSVFVAELPSPYRQAIVLTELEGLSQREAAEMVGLSLSGMKSRVQRGRERLREMFERCCEVTQDARGRVIACEPRSRRGGAC